MVTPQLFFSPSIRTVVFHVSSNTIFLLAFKESLNEKSENQKPNEDLAFIPTNTLRQSPEDWQLAAILQASEILYAPKGFFSDMGAKQWFGGGHRVRGFLKRNKSLPTLLGYLSIGGLGLSYFYKEERAAHTSLLLNCRRLNSYAALLKYQMFRVKKHIHITPRSTTKNNFSLLVA